MGDNWEKREEEHVSALREAEAIFREIRWRTGEGIARHPVLTILEIDRLAKKWIERWIK